jgi:hypothetical protein
VNREYLNVPPPPPHPTPHPRDDDDDDDRKLTAARTLFGAEQCFFRCNVELYPYVKCVGESLVGACAGAAQHAAKMRGWSH